MHGQAPAHMISWYMCTQECLSGAGYVPGAPDETVFPFGIHEHGLGLDPIVQFSLMVMGAIQHCPDLPLHVLANARKGCDGLPWGTFFHAHFCIGGLARNKLADSQQLCSWLAGGG